MPKASFFGRYDIRGIYGKDFSSKILPFLALALQKTFGSFLYLGRDTRRSSFLLQENLLRFLQGRILVLPPSSVPVFYLFGIKRKLPFGIYITASHLDSFYTGLKFFDKGLPPTASKIEELKKTFVRTRSLNASLSERTFSKISSEELSLMYLSFLKEKLSLTDLPCGVVFDFGGGSTALYAPLLSQLFPTEGLSFLFEKVVFPFPRPSNPYDSRAFNLLETKMLEAGAKIGFGFDSDGDRASCVWERLGMVSPQYIGVLLSVFLSFKKVVVDSRFSWFLEEFLRQKGIKVVRSVSWHVELKHRMKRQKADFGFEVSGHFIWAPELIDDGLFTSLKILELISKVGKERVEKFLLELKEAFPVEPEFSLSGRLSERHISKIKKTFLGQAKKIWMDDGISVLTDKVFFNVRSSLSEPVVRVNIGAKDFRELELTKEKLYDLLS